MASFSSILKHERLGRYIEQIMEQNARTTRLDGWFIAREIMMERLRELPADLHPAARQAELLAAVCARLPIRIRHGEIFAGAESDAFARSYALINPGFKIESFEGYCDEDAVYNDIEPDAVFTKERIGIVRKFWAAQPFARAVSEVYEKTGAETREVVYFVERVTGHTIPDFSDALQCGIDELLVRLDEKRRREPERADYFAAMHTALEAAVTLAERYALLAQDMAAAESDPGRRAELELMAATLLRVPRHGARNLFEAIQSFIILWQALNLEQAPNPFAFSIGNLDRILQPYFDMQPVDMDLAVQLVRHLLAFFCVGDRNWAISQNIMAGGMDERGNDLTCGMTHAVIRAFEESNYAQPNLSVKLHPGTPEGVYMGLARFMFEFGHSTPSFFNDPVMFRAIGNKGVRDEDKPLYAAAGCQEPLVMGRESANTTNSWLNLAKVLELAVTGGTSAITGERVGPAWDELGLGDKPPHSAESVEKAFFAYLDYFLPRMAEAANACTRALALLPVPFHSAFMGARDTGIDMRDCTEQGVAYNGSGCLIHGMANVADSFSALHYLQEHAQEAGFTVGDALQAAVSNFEGREELRDLLLTRPPKFGNNDPAADARAQELVGAVNRRVLGLKNPLGNPFSPDWSTPSTNLLYGYWTGATPDGRAARAPLAYGLDPAVSAARRGLLARVNSQAGLEYDLMTGGSASGMSINPDAHNGKSVEDRARYLREVMSFVFDYNHGRNGQLGLQYVYFNVFSQDRLRHVMEHPEEYPNPVLVRIHGQYGDARHLSPDILGGDIIPRLDPLSTAF